jgi:two-component system, chemotaxis family, protein-glutamate methylesterase/glutaminase
MNSKRKIRVIVVDDSALTRKLIREILSQDKSIEVIATANDPYIARNKIKNLNPDVITLDVEMPKMDGISFLKNIMRLRPMPVIMVSSQTRPGTDLALEALGLGAVDYIGKPDVKSASDFKEYARALIEKVKAAAIISQDNNLTAVSDSRSAKAAITRPKPASGYTFDNERIIIAIGASTGGTEAIKEVVSPLKRSQYSIVIVQHIPRAFSKSFAERVNDISSLDVYEATDEQPIEPGSVYIAPGDRHLKIAASGSDYICLLDNSEPYNRHKPSVDILFNSVAATARKNSIGVLLTGMGSDGARGLKKMRESGAITIAQDEASSVVWGMPGEAVKMNAVNYILPLSEIPGTLMTIIQNETAERKTGST